jgi:hypothetical protein
MAALKTGDKSKDRMPVIGAHPACPAERRCSRPPRVIAACCGINPAFRFRADLIILRICQAARLTAHHIAFAPGTWNQHDHAGVCRLKVEEQYDSSIRSRVAMNKLVLTQMGNQGSLRLQGPSHRLLACPDMSAASGVKQRAECAQFNPFGLKKDIVRKLQKFFTAAGNLNRVATKL